MAFRLATEGYITSRSDKKAEVSPGWVDQNNYFTDARLTLRPLRRQPFDARLVGHLPQLSAYLFDCSLGMWKLSTRMNPRASSWRAQVSTASASIGMSLLVDSRAVQVRIAFVLGWYNWTERFWVAVQPDA